MSAFFIRPANISDAKAVGAIYNEAVLKTTATFDTEPRALSAQRRILRDHQGVYPFIVAEESGEVVGWACLSQWSQRCAYKETAENSVYVAESARGRGIGKALLAALLEDSSRRKFHTLLVRIAEGNPISVKLHKSFGFKSIGVMREVGFKFGRRLDVEMLQRML